jgi:hypothetical protein
LITRAVDRWSSLTTAMTKKSPMKAETRRPTNGSNNQGAIDSGIALTPDVLRGLSSLLT